jgi:two-component system nitrogen regulation sensor histidine kinase GlnL
MLDDLLIFSHDEAPRLEPTNIHRLLDDVLALVGMDPLGRGIRVERLFDPSIPEILLDPDRMTQVFLNLARNALQAMEGRGTLTISTRMRLERRITTPRGEQYPTLAVEVADTGPGIPDELLAELGTPFFTTRPGGTGLGLAVSMHWVARHDGTLRLDSRAGGGTCARVELPLRIAA